MRKLTEFSAAEYVSLLPLQHALKQWRTDIWQYVYKQRAAPDLAIFLQQVRGLQLAHTQRKVLIGVIAFEQPFVIDWLGTVAPRFLPDAQLLVFDNSADTNQRSKIASVCAQHGLPYLSLPYARSRHPNRSHGLAMNWIMQHVWHTLRPWAFGFIDHDLIPIKPVHLQALLAQGMYGSVVGTDAQGKLKHPPYWHLWAGFCFFQYARVAGLRLNFQYDFSRYLDTGGRNWPVLYAGHMPGDFQLARVHQAQWLVPAADGDAASPAQAATVEMIDDSWLHIGGISYGDNYARKGAFFRALRAQLEQQEAAV